MDIQKHVEYWLNSAAEDWEIAKDLVERKKTRHGLFFAHLTLEKATLSPSPEQKAFLAEFDRYQLEGRYPENLMASSKPEEANIQMEKAREIYQWLVQQL